MFEYAAFRSQLGQVFFRMLGSFFALFSCLFLCCFFVRFLVVLGCHFGAILGPFWDQNRVKIRICDFLIFIDFILVFPLFFRLGGSYFRLMLALFSHRFLYRFLVVFWSDFGVILGPFWGHFGGPNRSFLASIFLQERFF